MTEELHPKLKHAIYMLDGNREPDEREEEIVRLTAWHLSHQDDGDDYYCEDISADDCLSVGSHMLNYYVNERAEIKNPYKEFTLEDKNTLIQKMGGLPVPLDFDQALEVLGRRDWRYGGKDSFPKKIIDQLVFVPDFPHKLGFKTPSGKILKISGFYTNLARPVPSVGSVIFSELAVEDLLMKKGVEFRFIAYDLPRWITDLSGVTSDREFEEGFKAALAYAQERLDAYLQLKQKFPDQVGLSDERFGFDQVRVAGITEYGDPFLVKTGTPFIRFHSTNQEYKDREIYFVEDPENPGTYVLTEVKWGDKLDKMKRVWWTDPFNPEKMTPADLEKMAAEKIGALSK